MSGVGLRTGIGPGWRLTGLAALAASIVSGCGQVVPGAPVPAVAVRPSTVGRVPTITVQRATVGPAIPSGFVGLSMEYRGLEDYAGQDPKAISPVFVQLLRNLAPGQRPVLRIGGDSTDRTAYPAPGVPRSPGVKYYLNGKWLRGAGALARTLDARLIMGINLEADSRPLAAAEARAFLSQIGRSSIAALEIGNEPELYGSFPWYRTAAGRHVTGRPRGYDFAAYLRDFSSFAAALPHVPLAGPSAGGPTYEAQLAPFLAGKPRVGLATLHAYPLKNCRGANTVTMGQLLSDASATGLARSLAPEIAVARRRRVGLRIDEMNAISCGGQLGVSDTFGSALWAIKALFAMARAGVAGVNIHTVPGTINEIFGTAQLRGVWQSVIHPEYYGLMMFAQAAPAGARLLRIAGAGGRSLQAWATRSTDGHVRVMLINSQARSQTVDVRITGRPGPGTLVPLRAPSLHSRSGVSLGGQSFASPTSTGQLAGPAATVTVNAGSDGYRVTLRGAGAVLLTR